MIVSYVTFSIGVDPDQFASEYGRLARLVSRHPGCVTYELLADPADSSRWVMIEVWASAEDHAAHLTDPPYIELLARGSREWGMHDVRINTWREAEGHSFFQLDRTDTPVPGRDEMNRLVAGFHDGVPAHD